MSAPRDPEHGSHLVAAGRPITDLEDRLRRYCGLSWSGGPPEVWAFDYFDRLPTGDQVDRIDVLAAGALHRGLSRDDLEFFVVHADELNAWLAWIPDDVPLHRAKPEVIAHLEALAEIADLNLPLVSKVLHRHRPALVPMVDRHLLDRYRPITGERSATAAWPSLVRALAADLAEPANEVILEIYRRSLITATGVDISRLRVLDIAVWMEGR